jgi:hypothetical protein
MRIDMNKDGSLRKLDEQLFNTFKQRFRFEGAFKNNDTGEIRVAFDDVASNNDKHLVVKLFRTDDEYHSCKFWSGDFDKTKSFWSTQSRTGLTSKVIESSLKEAFLAIFGKQAFERSLSVFPDEQLFTTFRQRFRFREAFRNNNTGEIRVTFDDVANSNDKHLVVKLFLDDEYFSCKFWIGDFDKTRSYWRTQSRIGLSNGLIEDSLEKAFVAVFGNKLKNT